MKHQSMIRSVVTGFALTMAVATAQAQPGQATATQASSASPMASAESCGGKQRMQSGRHLSGEGHGKYGAHRMSGHGQAGMPGMGQFPASLIDQLALTEKQKVALMDAQTAASGMREKSRETRQAQRESMRKSGTQDSFDPRAMIEQQNKMRKLMQSNRESVQKKWLSFWDGLSKEQQAKVSEFMKQKMTERGSRAMGSRAG